MNTLIKLMGSCYPLILAGMMFCASAYGGAINPRNEDMNPTGKGWGEAPQHTTQGSPFLLDDREIYGSGANGLSNTASRSRISYTNGINYHNGSIITGTTNIYYIWYGNWTGSTTPAILNNLAQNIGGSPYYNINTTYYNAKNTKVSNSVLYKGATSVTNYPYGTALSDSQIQSVVSSAIASKALPRDPNGVYFVLTSKDVNATSGFCTTYCGWHSSATISGTDIKYAFVGDPSQRCPTSCETQSVSPNANAGADGMASVVAHELEEAVTDPDLNAWYDSKGNENADKCAWLFGTTATLSNGAQYNMTLGSSHYLIQQNWVNASGGYCAITY